MPGHVKGVAVARSANCPSHTTQSEAAAGWRSRGEPADAVPQVASVPILSLRPADSPRLGGLDKAHITRLVEIETPLPPILVDRRTMRVIDGMHRLMATSIQGRESIDVEFFDGSEEDIFLRAVQENIRHGLPLPKADRQAAAERIIKSHPDMSDRAIAHSTGLAAKTVAVIRKRAGMDLQPSDTRIARIGRDGKVRPLHSGEGRKRAAELLAIWPEASLREIAQAAGISPATVLDVRNRLSDGEPPVSGSPDTGEGPPARGDGFGARAANGEDAGPASRPPGSRRTSPPPAASDPAVMVQKLLRDPSLRGNEQGKEMLRLLHINAVSAERLPDVAEAVPPHCMAIIVQLARQYAKMWQDFARELDGRARIIDPSAVTRLARHERMRRTLPACSRVG